MIFPTIVQISDNSDTSSMLNQQQIQQFHRDGYLRSGKVLTDEQVEALRSEMERVIRDNGREDVAQPVLCRILNSDPNNPVWQIVNIWMASEPYEQLIYNPAIADEMAQLTGATELRIWHDQI